MTRAPLAVTLGDPAGVGPEIVAKTWSALKTGGPTFVAVGDRDTLAAAMPRGGAVERVYSLAEGVAVFPKALPVLDLPANRQGAPADKANAIIGWIETAVKLALEGEASGVVTAPIAKSSLYASGFRFPGHTEFLADLTAGAPIQGARGPVMMLTARDLRVALVTIHMPLREVADAVTTERVIHTARVTAEALRRDFGIAHPRLALAGLNPHAGESGTIGREEIDVLAPAVAALRAEGIDITDPKPADTLFHEEARRAYDAAVCLYHDQALIPLKTIDFWGGVNVTLGLPIVRTSPDHGTGFDIAGRGVARPDSMIAAVRLADQLATNRRV